MDLTYKLLRDQWYAKLKQSGFKDIEDVNSQRESLKIWDSKCFARDYNKFYFRCRYRYFKMCEWFLEFYNFDSDRDKSIWAYHSQGLYVREIAHIINSNKDTVNRTIRRLSKIMRGF